MKRRTSWFWAVAKAVVIAAGLLMVTTPGYATENARERRDARDTKQDSRQEAREQKLDCRAANQRTMPNAVRRSATPSRVAVKSHVTSDGEQRQGEQRQGEQRHRTKSRKRGFQWNGASWRSSVPQERCMNPYSKAGIRNGVGVHTLRHTFGAHQGG